MMKKWLKILLRLRSLNNEDCEDKFTKILMKKGWHERKKTGGMCKKTGRFSRKPC